MTEGSPSPANAKAELPWVVHWDFPEPLPAPQPRPVPWDWEKTAAVVAVGLFLLGLVAIAVFYAILAIGLNQWGSNK